MIRARLVVLACLAGCGARAPTAIDVDALLRARGPIEARRDLVIRIAADPRDVAAQLALAALAERVDRPSEAVAALEAVVALGGPLGVRWHAADRARLARLIAARGRTRLRRGSATALADLERARGLGAEVGDSELTRARIAAAIVALRHSDREVSAAGRVVLAALATQNERTSAGDGAAVGPVPSERAGAGAGDARNGAAAGRPAQEANATTGAPRDGSASPGDRPAVPEVGSADDDALAVDPSWTGARPGASPVQRGRFGAWLWQQGARRAAWDELAVWRTAAGQGVDLAPEDRVIAEAYVAAARWWTPLDRPAPAELPDVALRCAFGGCAPEVIAGDDARERAYLVAPIAPAVRDPAAVAAVAILALHQALRGEVGWGAAIAARVDVAAFATPAACAVLPGFVQPVIAQLAGAAPPELGAIQAGTADERLVLAAGRALAGAVDAEVAGLVGDAPGGARVRGLAVDAAVAAAPGDAAWPAGARAEAVARHAGQRVPGTASVAVLREIAAGFARDPVIADRLARDAVAAASDAAAMHASVAAVFDALGDPARARAAWQAAVDGSREPGFLAGLAEAQARQGDGDAALVTATSAAAASGDPAVVWTRVAEALAGSGRYVHALEAARSAIDLAGPDVAADAFAAAIVASHALGRDAQAAALADRRARIAPAGGTLGDRDASDPVAALEAHRRQPGEAASDRLWRASRWNARSVELRAALLDALASGDPRRAVVIGELVELAGDRDGARSRAAAAALIARR